MLINRGIITILAALLLNCSSFKNYLINRGNDLTDIIDIGLEKDVYGFNIITILPFVGISYNANGKGVGLRHSHIGFYKIGDPENEVLIEVFDSKKKKWEYSFYWGNPTIYSNGFHEPINPRNLRTKNKKYLVVIVSKYCNNSIKLYYKGETRLCHWNTNGFAPIEISLGLYFGFRVGFNVGEFVDFFAGIVGYDPIKDDYDENGNLPLVVSKDLKDNIILPPSPLIEKKDWESKLDALDEKMDKRLTK